MQFDNPFAWVLLFSTLVSVGLFAFVWRRRRAPGARATLLLITGVTVWTLGYGVQLFNTQVPAMLFWTKVVYVGVVAVGTSWLIFALAYTGRVKWLTRRNLLLLLIEPVIILLMIWTTEFHSLVYRNLAVVSLDGFIYLTVQSRGPFFWVHMVYSYITLVTGTFIIGRALYHSPQLYRGQMGALLVALAAPWVGNVIHLTTDLPVDPTPLAFLVTGLALALGVYRYRLFNVIPVARDLVMERIEEAVVVLDDLDRVVDANQAALSLFSLNNRAWIGKHGEAVLGPHWQPIQAVAASDPKSGEVNLGSSLAHWFDLRVSPIHASQDGRRGTNGADRPVLGWLLVFHDVQARKQAEEMMAEARDQALQASLLKSQLIANVSHDLRTPMNAILGFSEMLVEGAFGPLAPKQAEAIQNMFNSAQQVNLLISDLLDQALIEKGKLTLYPTVFDPAELLAGVRGMLGGAALQKGLDLHFNVDASLPDSLYGDVKRLQQILTNLVSNSIRFTDRGSVLVSLGRAGEKHWSISVTDTGRGIPPEAQESIFEPFTRYESNGRRQAGTGLGLAIVRHLVTMMGGSVIVESVVNQGSTFRVTLPLVECVEVVQ